MHFLTSYTPEFRKQLLITVEDVAKAGVDVIQFSYDFGFDGHILDMAKQVKEITERYNTKLCVNNRLDIANIVEADYLHIGQVDLPIEVARKYLDNNIKIGLTIIHESEYNDLADYYGVGPIFKTTTKTMHNTPIGLGRLKALCEGTTTPVTAIGGINLSNYREVLKTGVDDVAVIGDIYRTLDINDIISKYKNLKDK